MGRLGKGMGFFDFSERERELFGFGLAGVGLVQMLKSQLCIYLASPGITAMASQI